MAAASNFGGGDWAADALRDILRDYVVEHLADDDVVLVIDETGFLKQGKVRLGLPQTRRSSDWKRLSAGAGTEGPRLHDCIADDDLAFFTTWCPAGTSMGDHSDGRQGRTTSCRELEHGREGIPSEPVGCARLLCSLRSEAADGLDRGCASSRQSRSDTQRAGSDASGSSGSAVDRKGRCCSRLLPRMYQPDVWPRPGRSGFAVLAGSVRHTLRTGRKAVVDPA